MPSYRFLVTAAANILRVGLLILFLSAAASSSAWAESSEAAPVRNDAAAMEGLPAACTNTANSPVHRLAGVVTDQSGARVAHAQLILTCGDFRATTTAGTDGAYSFAVPAGAYRLVAEAAGFDGFSRAVRV